MSFTKSLATGLGDIGETLFGTGRLNYARGRLLAGRLGATEALTDHRKAQTRDLDFDYGNKSSLLNELQKALPGTPEYIQRQGLMSGEGMSDYAGGQAKAYDLAQKMKALSDMQKGKTTLDPVTQLGLRLGQTGADASMMSQRTALTPFMEQLLQEKQLSESALGDSRGALADFYLSKEEDQYQDTSFAKQTADEFDRVVKKFQTKPDAPMTAYDSFVLNQGKQGKKVTGPDLTSAFTRKSKVEGEAEKVKLTTKKIDKVKKDIELTGAKISLSDMQLEKVAKEDEKLGYTIAKEEALTKYYIARENDVALGRANGNVSIAEAGRLLNKLSEQRHTNPSTGKKNVPWSKLSDKDRQKIYNQEVTRMLGGGVAIRKGLGAKLGEPPMGNELKSDLDSFLGRAK